MIDVDQQRTCGRGFCGRARSAYMFEGGRASDSAAERAERKNMARKKSLKKLLEEYECDGQMSLDDYDEGMLFDRDCGESPFCDTPLTNRFTFVIGREVALYDLYGQEGET